MSSHSVEDIKLASRHLRGSLVESLADTATGGLRDDDKVLMKFHGSYQQDDRDLREERRLAKLEPAHSFMIRTRTPGGVLTPAQWLKLDRIATTYAERGFRITTRQTFQFHGIIKTDLKATMRVIHDAVLDTIAACGDVNRNVVIATNPQQSALHAGVYAQATAVAAHLLPRSRAWYEIWLDEEQVAGNDKEDEPIYGEVYLPRKFKIGFAIPPYNDIDVFAQDLGFVAIIGRDAAGNEAPVGYNVAIGGGMGATHGDPATYPRVADVLGFVTPERVVALAEAVMTTQRDLGNRESRKRARFKYTIDDHGLDTVKAEIERRAGFALEPARQFEFAHNGDRFGWIDGEGDRAHLTLRILSGRIVDNDEVRHLSGLRAIAQVLPEDARFRLTPNQNLVIANVPATLRGDIDALVAQYALDGYRTASPLRRNALACVALPTCGLAMAEAERYLPDVIDKLEALLSAHDLLDAPINLRLSGCPNGCSRPYLAEIALVGKAPGRYNLMLGADHRGQRLNTLYRENVAEADILAALDPLLAGYAEARESGEGFGDYLVRAGVVAPPRRQIAIEVQP
ncbi:assimilatory sulfite reductase (NADPH) hemoprotein subunit [Novilysobacter erysipheiresistens]|uniref:Sulfite reductase [NADPH] hemoprotein beta-component n=1 Tax=Novilysobacter erysipheiresistens TaxID=1749332 RepID=A0ABU7YVN8_9GAMM